MKCQSVAAQLLGCDAQISISNVSVQKRLFTSDARIWDLNLSSAPASSCPAGAPQTQIPSQGRKHIDVNPVTLHRNDSTGSLTAAKRGYDTESVVVVAAASSSPLLLHPPHPLCGRVGIRLSHTRREERPAATAESRIWRRRRRRLRQMSRC